jgi:hypothetical protein
MVGIANPTPTPLSRMVRYAHPTVLTKTLAVQC